MNKLINIILIAALALGVACKAKLVSDEFKANFEPNPQLIGANSESTKAEENPAFTNSYSALTATPNMGLYVVSEKLTLQSSGNTYDNVECVNTSGKFAPNKNLYYPSEQYGVKLKAYIPYIASVANPSLLPVTVSANQTTVANVKASDFLFGSTSAVSPGVQKVPVELKHALTLLHVTVEVPAKFMDRTVTGCTGAVIMNSPLAGTVNLSPDVPTVTANMSTKTTITPIKIAQTGSNPTLYTFEAVVFPHLISAGSSMFAIELTFGDALGNEIFVYQPKDALTLTSGGWHALGLKVADYGKLTLSSATINSWTTSNLNGTLSEMGVANTFDFTVLGPNTVLFTQAADYSVTSKIQGVKVVTSLGNSHKLINVTNNNPSSSSQMLKLQAAFGADAPASYEFRINTVHFYSDAACTSLLYSYNLSQTVTGGGLMPIVLYANKGVGGTWTPGGWGTGGTSTGKYDKDDIANTYKIVFCNALATAADPANTATKVDLYIGATQAYTITTGSMTPAGDAGIFSASMANYVVPTDETVPKQYPFTFSRIVITTAGKSHTITATGDEWQIQGQGAVSLFVTQK